MKVTRAAEYGILGMLALAEAGPRAVLGIEEIARRQKVPRKFMAKIFQKLQKKGLVVSRRGYGGGFKLARPAEKINLKQIIESLEGPIALSRCQILSAVCVHAGACRVAKIWQKAQKEMIKTLQETTLTKLARGCKVNIIK